MRTAADLYCRRTADPGGLEHCAPGSNLLDAMRDVSDVIPRGLLPITNGLLIIIGFLLILGGAPPMILLALTGIVLVGALQVTVQALRRQPRSSAGSYGSRPPSRGTVREFVVYFASTVGANYQVGMWLPYFVRSAARSSSSPGRHRC